MLFQDVSNLSTNSNLAFPSTKSSLLHPHNNTQQPHNSAKLLSQSIYLPVSSMQSSLKHSPPTKDSSFLHHQIQTICLKVQTDEIANTMRENRISQEFLAERIKEIIEETFVNEPPGFILENRELKEELRFCKEQFKKC